MATRYVVLANNGYRYEMVDECEAPTVPAARKWFKRKWEGHFYTEDFRVSRA